MGCSTNNSINVKQFNQFKNILTIEKYNPELNEDFGAICFYELNKNKFLISYQNNIIVIYDKINIKPIFEIQLTFTVNSILKLKNGNYILGGDYGEVQIISINLDSNTYEILKSINLNYNVSKILQYKDQYIIASFKQILFYNINDKNELSILKQYDDHLPQIDIFNIFITGNLLLSFAYGQEVNNKNEIIIYNLINETIVFKRSNASVMAWNNTVCQFNSNILAISGNLCEISLFDLKTFHVLIQIKDIDFFFSVIVLKNKILCGSDSGILYEYEYNAEENKLKEVYKEKIHDSSIFSITRTSLGELVTTSRDGKIKFFK